MNTCMIAAETLPYIEIHGGDTQPWVIDFVHENGTGYAFAEVNDYSAKLTITPISYDCYGTGGAYVLSPILTIAGRLGVSDSGYANVTFDFNTDDTRYICGKYIYQVEISYGEKLRVYQGRLLIKPNTGGAV